MPSVFRALAAVAASCLVVAQEPELPPAPSWTLAEVEQRLASDDLADVAWAGHCVWRRGLEAALPAVRVSLRRLAGRPEPSGEWARLQLLEALLQFGVEPDGAELLPHAVGVLRAPVLILAARRPVANRDFFAARMQALAGKEDLEWRICGNLLAAQPEPAMVASWLRNLHFPVRIVLHDESEERYVCRCGGGRVRGSACGGPTLADWPPSFAYELDADNAQCCTPNGFRAIAWRRVLKAPLEAPEIPPCNPQQAWRHWLQSVGGERTRAACSELRRDLEMQWTGLSRLRRVVMEEQRRSERAFAAMVAELRKVEWLSPDAVLVPQPGFEFVDRRAPGLRPLPDPRQLLAAKP